MRKFLMVMLMLSVIAFASCSNEDSVAGFVDDDVTELTDSTMLHVQQNMELLRLQNCIQDYNVTLFNQQQNPKTRGLWGWIKKHIKVIVTVAADAVGGVVGGIPGGLAASGIVGGACLFNVTNVAITPMCAASLDGLTPLRDSLFNNRDVVFNNIVPSIPRNVNDSIGYYHNKVLYNMFSDPVKAESFVNMDRQQQAHTLVSELAKEPYLKKYYGDDLTDEAKINKGIATADAVIEIAEEVESEDEFFARLATIGLTDKAIIDVMKEILRGLYKIDPAADDGTYYQKILDIIEASDLDDAMKLQLSDGVIIGQASNHLWLAPAVVSNEGLQHTGGESLGLDYNN